MDNREKRICVEIGRRSLQAVVWRSERRVFGEESKLDN